MQKYFLNSMKDAMKLKALIIFRAVWYKYDLWHPVQYV